MRIQRFAQLLLAVVAGHATLILTITLVQEGMFGGVRFQTTPLVPLLFAGILTTLCAVAGGMVAARICGKPFFPPAIVMCVLVIAETIYLISTGRLDGPLWFDVMAAGSLVVGILAGALWISRQKSDVRMANKALSS